MDMNISGMGATQPSYGSADDWNAQMQQDVSQVNTDLQELEELMNGGASSNVVLDAYNQALNDFNTAAQYLKNWGSAGDFYKYRDQLQSSFQALTNLSREIPGNTNVPPQPWWVNPGP